MLLDIVMLYLALCLLVNFHKCAISLPIPLYLLGYHLEALKATVPASKIQDNQAFLAEHLYNRGVEQPAGRKPLLLKVICSDFHFGEC